MRTAEKKATEYREGSYQSRTREKDIKHRPTFTSRRITLYFNPQSTATTLIGFPLPYTLTSYKKKGRAVNDRSPPAPQNTGKAASKITLHQRAATGA